MQDKNKDVTNVTILHLLGSLNLFGGTPRKIFWLAKKSKFSHFLFFTGNKLDDLNYEQERQCFIENEIQLLDPYQNRSFFKQISKIINVVKNKHVDIIQCNTNYEYLLGGVVKLLIPSVSLVFTFVGSASPKSKIKNVILELIFRKVEHFIFISEYVRSCKIDFYHNINVHKSAVVYNGILPIKIKEDYANKEQFVLTTISGLNHYKNLFILIDAIKILIDRSIIVHLNIIGDGPLKDDLKSKIELNNLDKYINLLGYQNDIGRFLSVTDVYVHPADKEGFGIAVIEAMYSKLPVILSNAGALPELIIHNESGILIDPYNAELWANAIEALKNCPTRRNELAKTAYQRVINKFSLHQFISAYENIYLKIFLDKRK